ncbi:MAG: hypothetical protein J5789_09405, partial [Oscillospiraceae bacterium]|nr:hypothetical protein [Oscillospiraceae bacterium]
MLSSYFIKEYFGCPAILKIFLSNFQTCSRDGQQYGHSARFLPDSVSVPSRIPAGFAHRPGGNVFIQNSRPGEQTVCVAPQFFAANIFSAAPVGSELEASQSMPSLLLSLPQAMTPSERRQEAAGRRGRRP